MDASAPAAVGEREEIYLGTGWLDEHGVVNMVLRNTSQYSLEHAREQIELYGRLSGGKKVLVLADIRAVTRQADREARKFYASSEGARFTEALAIIVGSDLTRLLANFFFRFHKPAFPMRMFTDGTEARAWLEEHRQ